MDVSGVRERQRAIVVPRLCLFGRCRTDEALLVDRDMTETNGFSSDGLLGLPFFEGRRLMLDFPRKLIAID